MRTSINTIKFISLLSVAFLLLTYCISLNEENKWLILNTPWLSNDFVFTIVGGTFASLLVILACEIQKHLLLKRQTEDEVYRQLFSLYTQIIIIHYNIKRQLAESYAPVPMNLVDEIASKGLFCLNNLNSIDFATFKTRNAIWAVLHQYNGKNGMSIRAFLQNSVFLKMAINEDRIAGLKQGRDEVIVTTSPNTHNVLKKIFADSSVILTFVELSLAEIDKECKYRYRWRELKRNVISGEENFVYASLDDFIKTPIIQFDKY